MPIYMLLPLLMITPTSALMAQVCDCTQPKISGLIDTSVPAYCNVKENLEIKRTNNRYYLYTEDKEDITWTGYSCSTWLSVKKIVGSFWIGSFDTTYDKKTILLSETNCWDLVQNQKCEENVMKRQGKSVQYIGLPI